MYYKYITKTSTIDSVQASVTILFYIDWHCISIKSIITLECARSIIFIRFARYTFSLYVCKNTCLRIATLAIVFVMSCEKYAYFFYCVDIIKMSD